MFPVQEITVSPSRTYVVIVHDVVCPNEACFHKIILPESFKNNSEQAKYFYRSIEDDRATRIIACVTFEAYSDTLSESINEIIFEEPKVKPRHIGFDKSPVSLENDMKHVREMLDAYNDEQEIPNSTFSMILRSILRRLDEKNRIIVEIEKLISPKT